MGLTPIEDQRSEDNDTSHERDTPGVRRRLRRVVSRVVGRLLAAVGALLVGNRRRGASRTSGGDGSERDATENREALAIRPSGQVRLGSGPARSGSDQSPPNRCELQVEARVRGDTLRVYDPNTQGAYITSDVYERVER